MFRWLTTFIAACSLIACSSSAPPKAELADVAKAKDEACACQDRACAVAARKNLDLAMAKFQSSPKQVDAELKHQTLSLVSDAAMCLGKFQ
jgi:hypothetical protein